MLVLGPVALSVSGRLVVPSARTVRALLAELALAGPGGAGDAGLASRLWGDAGGDAGLRVLVHRTRAWLRDTAGSAVAVFRTPSGYALRLDSGEVDVDRFNRMVAEAAPLLAADRAAALDSALALWRGPALDNVPVPVSGDDRRTALEQTRVRVAVDCAQAWLVAGQAARAAALLGPIVDRHPLDEHAHSVWIESLAASGRQADALAGYESLRVRLREELGIDPSQQVSRSLIRVLRQEVPTGAAVAEPHPVPAQLPAAVGAFVGRDTELRRLDGLLAEAGSPETTVAVIVGCGGVGKTTLAVRWAHQVADRFPDGQLHLDLLGYSGAQPVRPHDALARLLRALGVPVTRMPDDLDEAAALFRSTVAGRRVLVLLDNALDAAQVRPLLPGAPGCLVLVTSRDRMDGLVAINGATALHLGVLEPAHAVRLLRETVGAQRVSAERDAVAEIVDACGRLPLALRVVAAHLTARPALPLARYAGQLRERSRLTALTVVGDERATVVATFAHSYRRLDQDARRMFRLVGLLPGFDVTPEAAAALAGCSQRQARDILSRLAASHLLTEPTPDRYGCHDLLRAYGAELADQEDSESDRRDAAARLSNWYLAAANTAAERLFPQSVRLPVPPSTVDELVPRFELPAEASGWLERERGNIVATAQVAARHGQLRVTWLLADTVRMYLFRWRHSVDGLRLAEVALDAARRAADQRGEASAVLGLATVRIELGDLPRAREHCEHVVALSRAAGWVEGEVVAQSNLGILHAELGDLDAATRCLERGRMLNRAVGRIAQEAAILNNLGLVHLHAGRLADAASCHREALAIRRKHDGQSNVHLTLHMLGIALREMGQLDEAAEIFERVQETIEASGEQFDEAEGLAELAKIHCDRLRYDQARGLAESALRLAKRTADRRVEIIARLRLAEVYRHLHRLGEAAEHGGRAVELARRISNARLEADALVEVALTDQARSRYAAALQHARKALARCHQCGITLVEGRALAALARIHLAAGNPRRAAELGRLAIENHERTGSRHAEARAREVLAACLRACGDPAGAAELDRAASRILTDLGIRAPAPAAVVTSL